MLGTDNSENFTDDFARILKCDESLIPFSSFRIGGVARKLYRPDNIAEVHALVAFLSGEKFRILGGGTNMLFATPIIPEPIIIMPRATTWRVIERTPSRTLVEAAAGLPMSVLVNETTSRGLAGLDVMTGVPGTVGGAVVMNAGGKHGTIAAAVESVTVFEDTGEITIPASDIEFTYRGSSLQGAVVSVVRFGLVPQASEVVRERVHAIFEEKHATQPLGTRCAGCVFRNPPGNSAGRLIDEAGLKDASCGDAVVSTTHANFIVNRGRASAEDVLALIGKIRSEIERQFGITLETELEIW